MPGEASGQSDQAGTQAGTQVGPAQSRRDELGAAAAAAAAANEWHVLQYLSHNARHPLFFAATKTVHLNNGVWEVPFDIQSEVNAPDETVLYAKAVPRRVTGSSGGHDSRAQHAQHAQHEIAGIKSSHSVLVQIPGH